MAISLSDLRQNLQNIAGNNVQDIARSIDGAACCNNPKISAQSNPGLVLDRTQSRNIQDLVINETSLIRKVQIRRVDDCRGKMHRMNLDCIVTQGACATACFPTFTPSDDFLTYDVEKYRSGYDLDRDFLDCAIGGEGISRTILNQFSKRIANNQEYAAIMSDSSLPTGDDQSVENNLLGVNDGWYKLACECAPPCQVIDAGCQAPSSYLFDAMYGAIPRRYQVASPNYVWIMPRTAAMRWKKENRQRETNYGDRVWCDPNAVCGPWGLPICEVPMLPCDMPCMREDGTVVNDGHFIMLTPLENLVYITHSDVSIETERIPRCDMFEVTMHFKADFMIQEPEMVIMAKNLSSCGPMYQECECGCCPDPHNPNCVPS
jgi:hypothetical protein